MGLSNVILFPHDIEEDLSGPQVYPTLYRPFGTPSYPGDYNGGILQATPQLLGGLYLRVSEFTLEGAFTLDTGYSSPAISVTLKAVTQGDVVLISESQICQHQGWYASATVDGLPFTIRFGEAIFVGGLGFTLMGREGVTLPFFLDFLADGTFTSISWGQSAGDNCPVVLTLPVTDGGTFDHTGYITLTLQLGGRDPLFGGAHDSITGAFTLTATKFWPYDPDDGSGPIYDSSTGAWLRDPLSFLYTPLPPP